MKILLVHTQYQTKGGEDTVLDYENTLLRGSNEVEILCFQNEKGVKGIIQFLMYVWNIFASSKIKKTISEFKPDIIHLHNWHYASGPLIIRAAKKKNIHLVITLHNYRLLCPSATLLRADKIFVDSLKADFPWMAVKNKVYRNSYIQTFWLSFVTWFHKVIGTWNKVDQYIVLTEFARQLCLASSINISEAKLTVKPNFLQKENAVGSKYRQRGSEFLFIGRLSREKGVNNLIDAFSDSKHILNIGGNGPLKDVVLQTCAECANIRYFGNLDKAQVVNQMQTCSVLVFPSIWYEGMPMTIIESFSQALPVIAANLGAMASMIQNDYNGLLFEPGNCNDLKAKLAMWDGFSDNKKQEMSNNAYKTYLDKYTPEKNKEMLLKIYQDVIKENKIRNDKY